MKNKDKKTIIIILLLILLISSTSYIVYDKFLKSALPEVVKDNSFSNILVEGNIFDLNGTSCVIDNNSCIKEIEVAYKNTNHKIKIKYYITENQKEANYTLYIDGKKVDTLSGGVLQNSSVLTNFNAKLYIFKGKYLGFLREISPEKIYKMTIYNDTKKLKNEITIDNPLEEDEIEFDGTNYKYYKKDTNTNQKKKYSLTTDGNKIINNIVKKTNQDK